MAEARARVLWGLAALTLVGVVAATFIDEEPAPAPKARNGARDGTRDGTRDGAGRVEGGDPERRARPAAARAAPAAGPALGAVARAPMDAAAAAAIAAAWEPPPPPPPPPRSAAAIAAEAPKPPPLPFRAIGRLIDGDTVIVFLQSGNTTVPARRGEVIERNYRVEAIDDKQVTFTYLPLNLPQQLAIGSTQ